MKIMKKMWKYLWQIWNNEKQMKIIRKMKINNMKRENGGWKKSEKKIINREEENNEEVTLKWNI